MVHQGRPLIKTSLTKHSLDKAALYYVQLKTHSGNALFDLPSLKKSGNSGLTQVVADELRLAAKERGVTLEQWVIFPDALHALIFLHDLPGHRSDRNAPLSKPRRLTSFIAGLKAATAKRINLLRNQPGDRVWQRSYEEQLIKDDAALSRIIKSFSEAENVVMCGHPHNIKQT